MRRLGGRYTKPSVKVQLQVDGSLVIDGTAVAVPAPPTADGIYRLVVVDGALTYHQEDVPVVEDKKPKKVKP